MLHIKLKRIEFYREEVVPVSYETEVLFRYCTVYPLIMARLILYLFLARKNWKELSYVFGFQFNRSRTTTLMFIGGEGAYLTPQNCMSSRAIKY